MTKQDRIDELEQKLDQALKHTYVYDTHTLHCADGELYIGYGKDRSLVINIDTIYNDLPFLISEVCKEQKKNQEDTLERIKDSLDTL
tara:strand:+ start:1714 stop:1974 length:261 start_codon:yes stop_codon:yes gene_type:complete